MINKLLVLLRWYSYITVDPGFGLTVLFNHGSRASVYFVRGHVIPLHVSIIKCMLGIVLNSYVQGHSFRL